MRLFSLICAALMFTLSGCEGQAASMTATFTLTATSTPVTPTLQATPGSTSEPDPMQVLKIWWPDRLAAQDNDALLVLIQRQIEAFAAAEPNVQIDFRRKRSQDAGGIMSTLRAARDAAPGAMPDITLLRREDLINAVQNGLVQPLEGRFATTLIGDLYSSALDLGSIDNHLYGLPYTLDVLVMAYNPAYEPSQPHIRFDTFLEQDLAFAFPAARTSGLSDVYLIHYLSAGGSLAQNGTMTINPDALRTTLSFYEQALDRNLITAEVLQYTSSLDYQSLLVSGELPAGVVSTSVLSTLGQGGNRPTSGYIPTADGSARTVLNGWMWVIVTANADRQALAERFITWMMEADRQGEFTQNIGMLPSQQTTLRLFPQDGLTAGMVSQLLASASLPILTSDTATRAMNNALIAVITGERSAEAATQDAISQVGN